MIMFAVQQHRAKDDIRILNCAIVRVEMQHVDYSDHIAQQGVSPNQKRARTCAVPYVPTVFN